MGTSIDRPSRRDVVGLLPAGGQATRLAPLPCSKELYPLGVGAEGPGAEDHPYPKVISQYLLEAMRRASVRCCYFLLGPGKWDIPAYFGDGQRVGVDLAYLVVRLPYGVPYTLDQAYPFVQHCTVAMGFPDIIFRPEDALQRMLRHQTYSGADVVLGLFPTQVPERWDTVELDEQNRVLRVVIKQPTTARRDAWALAVWCPLFTQFLHDLLATRPLPPPEAIDDPELFLGDVFQAAIDEGLHVEGLRFDDGWCLDIGTPHDLARALRWAAGAHSEASG